MDQEKMARFIVELRKTNKLTQRTLAEKLHVTDKAISKWERGLSCPDIELLVSLSDILGVTVSELLNGERSQTDTPVVETVVETTLQYADKASKSKVKAIRSIGAVVFSVLSFLGILVCGICDIAIAGALTWSLYPISSVVFGWLVLFPLIRLEKNSVFASLLSLSLLVIPFLFVLNGILGNNSLLIPIGVRVSVVGIVYLWSLFVLFRKLRSRKSLALSFSLLLAIPVGALVNGIIANYVNGPQVDGWDTLGYITMAGLAVLFFFTGSGGKRRG